MQPLVAPRKCRIAELHAPTPKRFVLLGHERWCIVKIDAVQAVAGAIREDGQLVDEMSDLISSQRFLTRSKFSF